MLDLPDMDAAVPLIPFQNALIQPWTAAAPPLSGPNLTARLSPPMIAMPQSWLSLYPLRPAEIAPPLRLTAMPATVTPLSLATLLEPMVAFSHPAAATAVETALTAQSLAAVPAADQTIASTDIQPDSQTSLQTWAAIAEVRVVAVQDDVLAPVIAGLSACTTLAADAASVDSTRHQVWLKDHHIADFATAEQAEALAQQLRQWHQDEMDGEAVAPLLGGARPVIQVDDDTVVLVTEAMAEGLGHSPEGVALAVTNNLRQALGASPLDPGTVQMALDQLTPADQVLQGTASWYGPYFHGRITATGETFNQYALTAAHKTLPFGTRLKVQNLQNGRTVVVRINDRGPYIGERSLDLSKAAAQCLGSEHVGVVAYEALILQDAKSLDAAADSKLASLSSLDNN
ncbi:MAG: septal ring lytic transglycosylase RlpA family protein [Cyanobacteria bacterium J06648_16]